MVSQTGGFWHIKIISFVVILVTHIEAIAAYETMRGEKSLLSKFLFGVDFSFWINIWMQNFSYFEQKKKKYYGTKIRLQTLFSYPFWLKLFLNERNWSISKGGDTSVTYAI